MYNCETGYLEVILGSMFSGKTSKLVEVYERFRVLDMRICVINWHEDKRYSDTMMSTHDHKQMPCIWLSNLKEEFVMRPELYDYDVYLVNEAQFFSGLKDWVEHMVDEKKKKVYLAGLDGDYRRNRFGELLDVIPLADTVTKLKSLCVKCKNGTDAIFTKRITSEAEQKVIGVDNYVPLCRNCWLS